MNSHIGTIIGGLTPKGSLRDKGIFCENSITIFYIDKYECTMKTLVQTHKKYFDDLFPPGSASLFYSKTYLQTYKDIRWIRVDEVFPGRNIVLYHH